MLRWLALAVLLTNLAAWFWHSQQASPSIVGAAPPKPAGDVLQLLRDRPAGANLDALESLAEQSAAVELPLENFAPLAEVSVPAPPIPVCEMIGPIEDRVSARQLLERFESRGVAARGYQIAVPTRTDYWVHLGPMASRREALDMLRELQQNGIDSFVITEGELANGVSLGYFTRESSANQAMQERRALGYDAKVRGIPRFAQELWIVLDPSTRSSEIAGLDALLRQGTSGLEVRKNFCDVIASAEKFE